MAKKEKEIPQKEEMVSIYDPSINAFREVPISVAEKFIQSAKELERKLKEEKWI